MSTVPPRTTPLRSDRHPRTTGRRLAAALVLLPALCQAQWQAGLASLQGRLDTAERSESTGRTLNRESGTLTGWQARLGHQAGPHHLGLRWQQRDGRLDYQGINQFGMPILTTTHWHERDLHALYGHTLPLTSTAQLRPEIGLGWRRTERSIDPSPQSTAVTEVMQQQYLRLGAELSLRPLPALVLRAGAGWQHDLRDRLDVEMPGWADPFRLAPTAGSGFDLGLGATLQLDRHWQLDARWQRQHQRLSSSPMTSTTFQGRTVGDAYYPGSTQDSQQWHLALGARF